MGGGETAGGPGDIFFSPDSTQNFFYLLPFSWEGGGAKRRGKGGKGIKSEGRTLAFFVAAFSPLFPLPSVPYISFFDRPSTLAFPPEVNSPYLVPQSSLSLSISRFALSADDGKQMD